MLGKIVAEMNIRRMHIAKLARSFELKTNHFIPEIDLDEYQGKSRRRPDIEDIARSVRESWLLPLWAYREYDRVAGRKRRNSDTL